MNWAPDSPRDGAPRGGSGVPERHLWRSLLLHQRSAVWIGRAAARRPQGSNHGRRRGRLKSRVSFAIDRKCWVCANWLLHSTVARLSSLPFPFRDRNGEVTVECSSHFAHTQQFLSNAKLTLLKRLRRRGASGNSDDGRLTMVIRMTPPCQNLWLQGGRER